MRWSNVLVIFRREVRDQVRDRRTLFMIFVLPILLYPLLGMGVLQFSAAFEQRPRKVVLVGPEFLPEAPPLLNVRGDGFDPILFDSPEEAERLVVHTEPSQGRWAQAKTREDEIRSGSADAVVAIPADVRGQLKGNRSVAIPIDYFSTDERSQITYLRVREVLARWKDSIVSVRLARDLKPASYTEPIESRAIDVASMDERGGSVWARLFPFLLVMMSLTGAFYPAVDLCAGEKERGTMETLLISPASRSEIVMGKFLTVVLASMMTAFLNLLSMGLTAMQLAGQVGGMGPEGHKKAQAVMAAPSLASAAWMILLLIPLSVFFSAVCVALAVLARSMKEGQYYMTPLYMICLPLIFLTLAPGVELNLFYSLVPITGVSLLLRALILGDYAVAWRYFLPVLVPTMVYGAVALRWAVEQFESEDVLFREAERFDLRSWLRHLVRDREPLPTGAQALLCFALMLSSAWFLTLYLSGQGLASSWKSIVAGQAFILIIPVAMTSLLTSAPRRTLRLYWPRPRYLILAMGLVLALNPLVNELRPVVEALFPLSKTVQAAFERMLKENAPTLGMALLLLAVIPAICEEFAFRGFILSGMQHGHSTRTAIVLSALLFGFLHVLMSIFQQLFNATLLGLVLGLLAIRSGSILPGILFHAVNNGLAVAMGYASDDVKAWMARWLYRDADKALYHGWIVVAGALASLVLLAWLWRSDGHAPKSEADRAARDPFLDEA